ncbi:unnamed protein product [Rotaria socialis]|uniref:Phosphorylase b kinase regulatory subunit n=1 Tax=Rotaria socialis TaxID=392032 RepID=A0A818P7G2_9BILA|nr:unnamed protein product [Rotaria socialis]CAF3619540.1 unnamed protein product [Rotaria socialis]CAF4202312.1 unnamed protein product [Rotaria socialis]CAF4377203.1 unnamed protein product [Rotaria socialis]
MSVKLQRKASIGGIRGRTSATSEMTLDDYYHTVAKTILCNQNPLTGLFAAGKDTDHAWVRDNVYAIMAVWGLSLSYKKHLDQMENWTKCYELEQSVVKTMRGLLTCMMKQVKKVEKFKTTLSRDDALHAKYSSVTGNTAVGDNEWGHLQLDATSLYLLMLGEMTSSGLHIVYTLDEVDFVQNLIFYIEQSYMIPDYGIWERGDKTNHGYPELNSSSVGMAKAALEALNELDLFGSNGGPRSIIHVSADYIYWCHSVLKAMLPRESFSKETDASLLSIISYPAFSIGDLDLVAETKTGIITKLQGRYGLARFLRDGHKTPLENASRLHYDPHELKRFEKIECEWPLFFCYLILDGLFREDDEQVSNYCSLLEKCIIKDPEGVQIVPELYAVPPDRVEVEKNNPHSTDRIPMGRIPHMWGQSLFVLAMLVKDGFLAPGELDPLNRRLITEPKPEGFVQVCLLTDSEVIQKNLAAVNIHIQQIKDLDLIQVRSVQVLQNIYSHLGRNERLGLTGRPSFDMGPFSTSKLYTICGRTLVFTPSFMDQHTFYLASDIDYIIDRFRTYIAFLNRNWNNITGRPVVVFVLRSDIIDVDPMPKNVVQTLKKIKAGYTNGVRVHMGKLEDFINTSCVASLDFVFHEDDNEDVEEKLMELLQSSSDFNQMSTFLSYQNVDYRYQKRYRIKKLAQIRGAVKRSYSYSHPTNDGAVAQSILNPNNTDEQDDQADTNVLSHIRTDSHTLSTSNRRDSLLRDKEVHDIIALLPHAASIHDQADILHYLCMNKGIDFEFEHNGHHVTVRDLIQELYTSACKQRVWWCVRHSAGMLGMQNQSIAQSLIAILAQQKQLTIGLPPAPREHVLTSPMTVEQLYATIVTATGDDPTMVMLTQEILVFLHTFISTEPQLFTGMIRIRVGLIVQVMLGELKRTLQSTDEDTTDHLLNLSPYEIKCLLHIILSGKEFGITEYSTKPIPELADLSKQERDMRIIRNEIKDASTRKLSVHLNWADHLPEEDDDDIGKHGQWIRRRRLDGALNRVPVKFYGQVWQTLEKCKGIKIADYILYNSLTQEMTQEEIKFALRVEEALNRVPFTEYRQLIVEACVILTSIALGDARFHWDDIISIEDIVSTANGIFLQDQVASGGDATKCCASGNPCGSAASICLHFYDSAPSGRFGTINYFLRALLRILHVDETTVCAIS